MFAQSCYAPVYSCRQTVQIHYSNTHKQKLEGEQRRCHFCVFIPQQTSVSDNQTFESPTFIFFLCGTKCQQYRSNSSPINYTENLWTSKCHPETLHLTRCNREWRCDFITNTNFLADPQRIVHIHPSSHNHSYSHTCIEWHLQSQRVPVCPLSILGCDRFWSLFLCSPNCHRTTVDVM